MTHGVRDCVSENTTTTAGCLAQRCYRKKTDIANTTATAGCLSPHCYGRKTTLPILHCQNHSRMFVKNICLHITHQLTLWCRVFALTSLCHGTTRGEDPLVTVLDMCTTAGWRMCYNSIKEWHQPA